MIKKFLYTTLFLFLGAITLIIAMDQPGQPNPMEITRSLIQIKTVPVGEELELPEAGVIHNGFELLDTSKDEPNLMTPFSELINQKTKYGIPFILAVVSLQVPSKNCCKGSTIVRHAYYEANGLNTVIFGNIEFNNVKQKLHYYKNRLNMTPVQFLDPFSKQFITGIQYFIIELGASTATFLATDFDFFVDSPAQQFLVRLFNLHTKFTIELDAREADPKHSLKELYSRVRRLGDLYWQQNKLHETEHYYKQAADQNDDLLTKAIASSNLGSLYKQQNKLQEAEHYYKQAKELYSELRRLGDLNWQQNKLQEAEDYYKQAADQNDDLITKAIASSNLGSIHKQQNKLKEAERYYKQAADQNDNFITKAIASGNLGNLYKQQNKLQEAERYYKQAADQNDDLITKAKASRYLGNLYWQQNKLQEAERYYKQAAQQNENLEIQQKAQARLIEIREAQSKAGTETQSKRAKVDVDQ